MVRPFRITPDELPWRVELWSLDGQRVEVELAKCRDMIIARAAYDCAAAGNAGRLVTLLIGIRAIAQSVDG